MPRKNYVESNEDVIFNTSKGAESYPLISRVFFGSDKIRSKGSTLIVPDKDFREGRKERYTKHYFGVDELAIIDVSREAFYRLKPVRGVDDSPFVSAIDGMMLGDGLVRNGIEKYNHQMNPHSAIDLNEALVRFKDAKILNFAHQTSVGPEDFIMPGDWWNMTRVWQVHERPVRRRSRSTPPGSLR